MIGNSNITEVQLLMENCEVLTFQSGEIDCLELKGINKLFHRSYGKNKLELTTRVEQFMIQFNEKANRDYGRYEDSFDGELKNVYDRLSCQDLVAIILKNKDKEETYYIEWEDELDSYQDDPSQFLIKNKYGQALFGNHRETQEDLINYFNFIGGKEC